MSENTNPLNNERLTIGGVATGQQKSNGSGMNTSSVQNITQEVFKKTCFFYLNPFVSVMINLFPVKTTNWPLLPDQR